ncbi:Thymidylate synthase thyX (plasmid) [Borrelia nietonii YOR]|uniref:Thymidylate synthase thyX n=2 Tax=Borrelia TaxID=138 RepID=W5SBW3_9SPIR|nr:Thymidylate synthase thyX [Borrelia nietonii YOR]AHH14671.1 Thymidylate synthase thyX [Borrelia hermsii MTW]
MVVFTFYVKAFIFVAGQWMRHRTARINEFSGSYSLLR